MEKVIYKITNLVNDKFYVGSTINKKVRFRQHRRFLRQNRHHCKHLQAAWNLYGESKFTFEVVEFVDISLDLAGVEDTYLAEHVGKGHCYNSGYSSRAPWRGAPAHVTPNYGNTMSQEQKTVLSNYTKQQWLDADPRTGTQHSPETKAKISAKVQVALSEGRGGKFIPSEETRRKMSEALKGNQCAKGYKRTPEEIEKIRARTKGNQNWLGKRHSEESKIKMRKRILEMSTNTEFSSLSAALKHYTMTMPTLRRALLAGTPITKGRFTGLQFKYIDT
jgi:group I intron endonuclease